MLTASRSSDGMVSRFSLEQLPAVVQKLNKKERNAKALPALAPAFDKAGKFITKHDYLISELQRSVQDKAKLQRVFGYADDGKNLVESFHQDEMDLLMIWRELNNQLDQQDKWWWQSFAQLELVVLPSEPKTMIAGFSAVERALD
jgi:hypothetical protein